MHDMELYNEFSCFLKRFFPYKVQKISLNAGFTCPNRDGSKGYGGCTYCNNQTFNPEYCRTEKTITRQLEEGKLFFAHKYPEMKYLAYFQAYTNTYDGLDALRRKYEEALSVDGVVGLVIGTRPDCMPDDLLRYLEALHKHTFLLVEYGIESTDDRTLRRINRGHDFRTAADAVCRTAACGIPVGGHVILGLPGETHESIVAQAGLRNDLGAAHIDGKHLHRIALANGDIRRRVDDDEGPLSPEERLDVRFAADIAEDEFGRILPEHAPGLFAAPRQPDDLAALLHQFLCKHAAHIARAARDDKRCICVHISLWFRRLPPKGCGEDGRSPRARFVTPFYDLS